MGPIFFYPALDEMILQRAVALEVDPLFLVAFIEVLAPRLQQAETLPEQSMVETIKLHYCKRLVETKQEEWAQFDADLPNEIFASLSKEEDMANDLSFISWDGPVKVLHFKAYMEGSLYTHRIYARYPKGSFVELLTKGIATEMALARNFLLGNNNLSR